MKRLLTLNEMHAGQRYLLVPRNAGVQRGVGRGIFSTDGDLTVVGPYELDLIKTGALLPFDPEPSPASPDKPTKVPAEVPAETKPAKPKKGD